MGGNGERRRSVRLGKAISPGSRVNRGLPGGPAVAIRRFLLRSWRILHEWEACTAERQIPWDGRDVLGYRADERCVTIANAVVGGWRAALDTGRDELEPVRVGVIEVVRRGVARR
jgi:hypothetical protein